MCTAFPARNYSCEAMRFPLQWQLNDVPSMNYDIKIDIFYAEYRYSRCFATPYFVIVSQNKSIVQGINLYNQTWCWSKIYNETLQSTYFADTKVGETLHIPV